MVNQLDKMLHLDVIQALVLTRRFVTTFDRWPRGNLGGLVLKTKHKSSISGKKEKFLPAVDLELIVLKI